jgi:pimeloyl-ACP methyl ester carboxylesterase
MAVLTRPSTACTGFPGYWAEFDDITEKNAAEVSGFRTSDGYNLTVYAFGKGNRDAVLIVNPLATPFLLMARLAAALAETYHVVSWESRGGPFLGENMGDVTTSIDRQAKDLAEVAAHYHLTGFHAVSYCSGGPITAWAASHADLPIKSISLLAPSGAGVPDRQSQYQDVFAPMLLEAGTAETAEARRIAQVMQDYVRARHGDDGMAGEISRLTYLNMRDLDRITGLARILADYWNADMAERRAQFDEMCRRHPVMVMHCLDDTIAHHSASLKACLRTGLAKLVLYPTGGHFKLCECNSDALRDVLTFMAVHDDDGDAAIDWPKLQPGLYLGPLRAVDW